MHMVIGSVPRGAYPLFVNHSLSLDAAGVSRPCVFRAAFGLVGKEAAGEAFRRLGLLQIEEEKSPPPIAREAAEAQDKLETGRA